MRSSEPSVILAALSSAGIRDRDAWQKPRLGRRLLFRAPGGGGKEFSSRPARQGEPPQAAREIPSGQEERAPVTSMILALELSRDYGILMPVMIACILAHLVTRDHRPAPIITR